MQSKIFFVLWCVAFPCLFPQAQAQMLRIPAATLPTHFDYSLVYLYLPDTPHQQRSHWHWVLRKAGSPASLVDVKSLDSPRLKASIRRIPAGDSIGLAWQFRKAELARQAGLSGLQQLCTRRKIGLQVENWASSYAEK